MLQKKKVPKNYGRAKRAFDEVLENLRRVWNETNGHVGAINPEACGGAPRDPAKPTPVEFRADALRIIQKTLPKNVTLVEFMTAYLVYDSEDAIERGVHAEKILGARMHSVEQRMGAAFIETGIFPVMGKGYFYHLRIPRGAL